MLHCNKPRNFLALILDYFDHKGSSLNADIHQANIQSLSSDKTSRHDFVKVLIHKSLQSNNSSLTHSDLDAIAMGILDDIRQAHDLSPIVRSVDEARELIPRTMHQVYGALFAGINFYDISLMLSQSIDHVFQTLRFIERRLLGHHEQAPLDIINQQSWEGLTDIQRLSLELDLCGFNRYERQRILALASVESADSAKTKALSNLGLNNERMSDHREHIRVNNLDQLDLDKLILHRILEFSFDFDDLDKEPLSELSYKQITRILKSIQVALDPEQSQLLDLILKKVSNKEIASSLECAEITASRKTTALRNHIRTSFASYCSNPAPDSSIPVDIWHNQLDALHRKVFSLKLLSVPSVKIMQLVNSDPALKPYVLQARRSLSLDQFDHVSQIETVFSRTKKLLGINDVSTMKALQARIKSRLATQEQMELNALELVLASELFEKAVTFPDFRRKVFDQIKATVAKYVSGKYVDLWDLKIRGLKESEILSLSAGFDDRRQVNQALRRLIDHLKAQINLTLISSEAVPNQEILNLDQILARPWDNTTLDEFLVLIAGFDKDDRIRALAHFYEHGR